MDDASSPLDDSLLSTLEMVWCAFDGGIGDDEYWPLIAVLIEVLPRQAAAKVISVADANFDYWRVLDDAMAFTPEFIPDWGWVDWMRGRLAPCGYDEWTREDRY